jgi:Flp pilus assembly protein TadG
MKPIKGERGQSLVELGISLLILVYLLAGLVEFGVLFFQYIQLRDAAQEGALYGSTRPFDVLAIVDRVKYSSDSPLDLPVLVASGDVTVSINIDGISSTDLANYAIVDCEGHGIQVVVGYEHQIFMPFMAALLGSPTIPLSASVTDTILTPLQCTP